MAKITEEELKRLQGMNQEFTKTKLAIADSVLQQKELIGQMDDLRSAFKVDEKSLTEKYGKDVSIDLGTGEIKENVPEVKAEPVK
mgnify:FL=1|tara:strand:- start:1339 stop:1593 length:255 start_codon:yes stop_codon:yes gene_type:complete